MQKIDDVIHILFVCSRNQWRSPTAERIYRRAAGVVARSAGTSAKARRTVSAKDIEWADVVIVMERKHSQRLRASFSSALKYRQLVVLDIPDDYTFMDEELIERIREGVDPVIQAALDEDVDDVNA